MPGLAHYMAQYDHEHHSLWNKLLHAVGIPLIFAGSFCWCCCTGSGAWRVSLLAGLYCWWGIELRETIPHFFRVRFTCWSGPSGC